MTVHEMIARFRDLLAQSTPGPWKPTYGAQRDPVCVFPIAGAVGNEPSAFFIHGANGKNGTTNQECDAALIIAMHTRLPEILDVLERATDERDILRATQSDTMAEVVGERIRQDQKWGGPEHDDEHSEDDWHTFIGERLDNGVNPPLEPYRHRMLEIAALAVAAVESFDRKAKAGGA